MPILEVEELEEEEESMAEDSNESEEGELPSTPPPDKKPRRSMNTQSSDRKKPTPVYRSLFTPKRQAKIPGKGKGSNKKPKGK